MGQDSDHGKWLMIKECDVIMLETKKDNRIEVIRVVAMFLVILLHVVNRYLFKCSDFHSINYYALVFLNSITRISVPLFFMISGIVNIPKQFNKKKYVSRIIRMITVLIVWTLVYYFVGNYKVSNLLHSMYSFLKPHFAQYIIHHPNSL